MCVGMRERETKVGRFKHVYARRTERADMSLVNERSEIQEHTDQLNAEKNDNGPLYFLFYIYTVITQIKKKRKNPPKNMFLLYIRRFTRRVSVGI